MRTILLICFCLTLTAAVAAPKPPVFGPHRFADYPAEVYQGPRAKPDFKHSAKGFWMFRTRIRDGAKAGANFAGHWAIVGYGCGTGCVIYDMVDVVTGAIRSMPLGGEHSTGTVVMSHPDSRLIKAFWEDFPDRKKGDYDFDAPPICRMAEVVLDGDTFTTLWSRSKKGQCPFW